MHVNSTVAQMVSHPHNLASARATGFPVLRSLDAAAVVLGYSLTYLNQVPISVEVNHLYAEGRGPRPVPFTTRTHDGQLTAVTSHQRLHDHAVSHRMNADTRRGAPMPSREQIRSERQLMARLDVDVVEVLVDGRPVMADGFEIDEVMFVRLLGSAEHPYFFTAAVPIAVLGAGFTTAHL